MSILVVQALYEGIIMGADRNITSTSITKTADGRTIYVFQGQSQRPKVLRWPNSRALVGYVGVGTIGGLPTDEWLYNFIGRNMEFCTLEELAQSLGKEVQSQRIIDEGREKAEALIIHLAGFDNKNGIPIPVIWFIRNPYRLDPIEGYVDIRKEYLVTEELWKKEYIGDSLPETIREYLRQRARDYHPHWFHQGFDLGVFNTLDAFLRASFRLLIERHPKHSFPETLTEWSRHLSMAILTYGAYFQSFYGPSEQYVGGGVDIVSLPWPDS